MIFRLNWCKNIINGERIRTHVGASGLPARGGRSHRMKTIREIIKIASNKKALKEHRDTRKSNKVGRGRTALTTMAIN